MSSSSHDRRRLLGATLLPLIALVACGRPAALDERTRDRLADADRAAADALATARAVDGRVDRLQQRIGRARRATKRLTRRLEVLSERLRASLGDLRAGLADASSTAGAASSDADSAASRAAAAAQRIESVAKDLSVLTQRFDYHLREGGG